MHYSTTVALTHSFCSNVGLHVHIISLQISDVFLSRGHTLLCVCESVCERVCVLL